MSDPVSEVKARLLLEELNRRNRWLTILRSTHTSARWWKFFHILFFVFAMALIWESFDSGPATAIFMLTTALCLIMGSYTEDVHRRVDALVELLQQEGLLSSTLPTSHEGKPGDNRPPAENLEAPRRGDGA